MAEHEDKLDIKPKQGNGVFLYGLQAPAHNVTKKPWIIYPDDPMKIFWDILISIVLLASCFTTPYNLAFSQVEDIKEYYVILVTMDILFAVDIIVNFNSAYEDEKYKIIDKRNIIVSSYTKGWFFIDLFSILPLGFIIQLINGSDDGGGNINSLLRVARIGKLYKLVKITRLVRLFKVMKNQGNLFNKLNHLFKIGEGCEKFMFFMVIFLMLCHFMACFWIFTADMSIDQIVDDAGNLIDDPNKTNWILANEFAD